MFIKEVQEEKEFDIENGFLEQKRLQNKSKLKENSRLICEKSGICRACGKETSDWVVFYGENNTCICRECRLNNKG